jgi:hypothetical protein
MPRHLCIVSRHSPQLYDYLIRSFSGEPEVEVLVDRRKGSRRGTGTRRAAPARERRVADRRSAPQASGDLRALGYAFVRQG